MKITGRYESRERLRVGREVRARECRDDRGARGANLRCSPASNPKDAFSVNRAGSVPWDVLARGSRVRTCVSGKELPSPPCRVE